MSTKNTGGPAFPCDLTMYDPEVVASCQGMYLRDYFAAKAMQGMLAATPHDYAFDGDVISEAAYEMADAMLRDRGGGGSITERNTQSTAADGKTELVSVQGHPLLVSAVEFNRMVAQRDELLEALQRIAAMSHEEKFAALDMKAAARAAIAKVEGGAA